MTPDAAFHHRVASAVRDERVIRAVHLATLHKVQARAAGMAALRNYERIRALAAQIKQHTLENLADYLQQLVSNLQQRGATVHVASDAAAARDIICGIARRSGARLAVKAKSMTSEEIHLNEALQTAGVTTVETDLGEFIVQLDHDRPSHIVTPIIHKDRRQIAEAMQRELGCAYTQDPRELTAIARRHLRGVFARCDLGITGVNFAVAESGTLCICTNEGNGRMTVTRPRVHVALMGIEKVIPRLGDLPVFLKLLARSSTGQPMTVYTTLVTGPRRAGELDGPDELHVVLMDNGRSTLVGGRFAEVLRCIRCGACLNACPVYRNIGGHAYGGVYPGPIGSLVSPLLHGLDGREALPRASSLCGACRVACPVNIDIPSLLVRLRTASRDSRPLSKRIAMRLWQCVLESPALYTVAQWLLRRLLRDSGDGWSQRLPGSVGGWTTTRDVPIPRESFRNRWRRMLENAHEPD